MPQLYRFHDHDEHVFHSSLGTDAKTHWGWCNLEELMEFLSAHDLSIKSTTPVEFLSEFSHLHRQHESVQKGKSHELPMKWLFVTILTGDNCRFVKITNTTKEILQGLQPSSLYVPSGWAEKVVSNLRTFGRGVKKNQKNMIASFLNLRSETEIRRELEVLPPRY